MRIRHTGRECGWRVWAGAAALAASTALPAPAAAPAGASKPATKPVAEKTGLPARVRAPAPGIPSAGPALTPAQRKAQIFIDEGFFDMKIENREKAIASFRKALEADPKSSRAMFGLGTALIASERYAEAIKVLESAIVNDPADYFVRNNLAWLFATARDIRFRDGKRAVALAQESMLLAPSDYHVWSTLAEGYFISGDYTRAQRSAEEAERLARAAGADPAAVQEYTAQVERCRSAARAMDILE